MGSGPHGKKRKTAPCVQQADCQLDTVLRKSNRWLCPAQNGVDLHTALMVHMMVKPLDGIRYPILSLINSAGLGRPHIG